MNPWGPKILFTIRDFIFTELGLIQIHLEREIGTMVLVHNTRMLLLSGFMISDPDCILILCEYTGWGISSVPHKFMNNFCKIVVQSKYLISMFKISVRINI